MESISLVRLFATPWTVAHHVSLSMGFFSRQEYWSGLPFTSPRDVPNPGIEPKSPALQADSLPSDPPGKSKNTGVGSLSLLQGLIPTQESNWGLLHCRWILYQLSYQGSPSHLCLRVNKAFILYINVTEWFYFAFNDKTSRKCALNFIWVIIFVNVLW